MNTSTGADIHVSIIIVNYNTAELTLQCIRSIRSMVKDVPYEIIVVDNHSSDDSAKLLEDTADIILICNEENVGFGRANNQGVERAKGNYLFFVNSDTYFLNDAVSILHTFMEAKGNEGIACCGGTLLTPEGEPQASYGNFPSVFGIFSELGMYRFYKKRFFDHLAIAVKNADTQAKEVDYISGADLFVSAEVFRRLGGFDSDFFLYFEETELAWRLKRAGFKSAWVPAAKVVHLEGGGNGTVAKWPLYKLKSFSRSRQLYFRKTQGPMAALAVKVMLAMQAFVKWIYHREKYYFNVFRIIVAS
ncbi:glycosyltransferase family 2 protein [Parapedobacter sp. DT-150]|uniref:glycosyltransferase family 2 protein n=1 Tax=Parapedobacter sp. DT-150 TaxID=3396162 RepID=UPI003F1CAF0C